jgi:CDGSH iron-sulfur domain-containing protein 3
MVKISALENGPYMVEVPGTSAVTRAGSGETVEDLKLFLCRCGHSENKPYCDGTHRKNGFAAPLYEVAVEPSA